MKKIKKQSVSIKNEFDAHSILYLVSREVGHKVTAVLKKQEVNQ